MARFAKGYCDGSGTGNGRGRGINCRVNDQGLGLGRGGGRRQRFQLQTPLRDAEFFRGFCLGTDNPQNANDTDRDAQGESVIDDLQRKIDALKKRLNV